MAVSWIDGGASAAVSRRQPLPARRLEDDDEVRFGHGLPVHRRGRRCPRHAAVPSAECHRQLEPVAGNDLSTELGIVHATKPRAASAGLPVGQEERRDLHERLDHEHARHQRRARKVSLEVLLVDRDVLHGHDAASRLVFRHRIHEHGRIAVRKAIENERDVHADGGRRVAANDARRRVSAAGYGAASSRLITSSDRLSPG